MSAEIVKLVPETVGEGFTFNADDVLEDCKGHDYSRLLVIGETEDGALYLSGNASSGEMMILMEMAKHAIVFGD